MLSLSGLSSIALTTLSVEYRVWCCSVTQSCLTLCHPMDCSLPALSVRHHLPEFAQVHVHCIGHDIQPSNPLIPSFPSPLYLSSIRDFSNESAVHIRWSKYWSFSFSISPSTEYLGLISFQIDWYDLFAVQRTHQSLLQHHSSKASILGVLPLWSSSHNCTWPLRP